MGSPPTKSVETTSPLASAVAQAPPLPGVGVQLNNGCVRAHCLLVLLPRESDDPLYYVPRKWLVGRVVSPYESDWLPILAYI
jgi:hypothetical protein